MQASSHASMHAKAYKAYRKFRNVFDGNVESVPLHLRRMENGVYYLLRDGFYIPRYMYRFVVDQQVVHFSLPFTMQHYFEGKARPAIQRGVLRSFVFIQLLA
jgi:hypothetical protein